VEQENLVWVKNVSEINQNACMCGSWLKHWVNFSHRSVPLLCSTMGCLEKAVIGAPVQIDDSTDQGWYIVPLCKTCHGKKGQALELGDSVPLAPASVERTCGKTTPAGGQ
jgi:hypothetical protein